MVSPAPTNQFAPPNNKEDTTKKPETEFSADEEAAFQALLNSQREVLARMGFGNSNSEILVVDGPDNLPLVSPHNSAHWSYGNDYDFEYHDVPYEQQGQQHSHHYPEQQQPYYQDYHHQGYQHSSYHHQQQQPHAHYQQQQQQQHASLAPREASMGVGDDCFILDHIDIGPPSCKGARARAPVAPSPSMRRRKRDAEQELVYKKKQQRGSSVDTRSYSEDLLPSELDESSSSLLLEDLDFSSVHSRRDRAVQEDSQDQSKSEPTPAAEEEPAAVHKSVQPCVSLDHEEDTNSAPPPVAAITVRRRPPLPKRSSRNLWKPRRRSSADISIEERRSMWKPRSLKRNSSNASSLALHDSCASLQLEDLAASTSTTEQDQSSSSVVHQVSLRDGDLLNESASTLPLPPRTKRLPSRSSSTDSAQSLSVALAQSRGSTQTIQEWDKKMGLKRSHSKTMRQTTKSREQLLAFFLNQQEQQHEDGGVPKTIVADREIMEI